MRFPLRHICVRFLLLSYGIMRCILVYAQQERSIGVSIHKGFIFAHSKDVENTAGSYPIGIQLEYNKQLLDEKTWEMCNCYPRTGYFLQYFNYDNAVLGSSIHTGTYIEPYWGYRNRVGLSLKGMAGLGWLSNPYHPAKNPVNQSYSLPVSAYVALGLGLHLRLTNQLQVNAYANYNHISNGGIKDPNKGINWPTASLGLVYVLKPITIPQRIRKPFDAASAMRKWEAYTFWSSRTAQLGEKKRWQIWGIGTQYTRQVAKVSALTAGAEIWYDYSLQERLRRDVSNASSSIRSGVMAGHVFLMGRFFLSQQMGLYVFNPSGYFPLLYQRYGLQYTFNNKWSAGANVLVHGHVANFVDFRVVYQLR